jgi:hypothetical protein
MSAVENYVSATEIRAYLNQLQMERLEAKLVGLDDCRTYMTDLEGEIAQCRMAYVGAAVIEIAMLRGELSGRLLG